MLYRILGIFVLCAGYATAAPPIIYEGTLTNGDQPPDPWPGLRFSVVDADGATWWSTMVEPAGPLIEVGPDGRFVAYLEDSPQNPWALAGFDQGRWLRVEVCPGAWPANPEDDCQWVQLEQTQRLGTVPMAASLDPAALRKILFQVDDLVVSPDPADGQFATIHEALESLDEKLLSPGRDTRILVMPGLYTHDRPIEVWRSDSTRLQIIGQGDDPSDVILHFDGSDGLVVHRGARLGLLDGMTLVGDRVRGAGGGTYNGISARIGAHMTIGPAMIVREFTADCIVARGASMFAEGVVVGGCGDDGLLAVFNGYIEADGARVTDNIGQGVEAYMGGGIRAGSVVSNGNGVGFSASDNGWLYIRNASAAENGQDFVAVENSYINAERTVPPAPQVGHDASFIQ